MNRNIMKKLVGYVISILGLVIMATGLGTIKLENPIIAFFGSSAMTVVGIILIIIGVFISLKAEKESSEDYDEVPIYEGSGKNRKIVGYQRKG